MTEKKLTIVYASRMHSTLVNALQVATEKFRENAKTMAQVATTGGNPFLTANAAKILEEEFKKQANETVALREYLDNLNEPFTLIAEIEDEDEEEPQA